MATTARLKDLSPTARRERCAAQMVLGPNAQTVTLELARRARELEAAKVGHAPPLDSTWCEEILHAIAERKDTKQGARGQTTGMLARTLEVSADAVIVFCRTLERGDKIKCNLLRDKKRCQTFCWWDLV